MENPEETECPEERRWLKEIHGGQGGILKRRLKEVKRLKEDSV